MPNPYQRLYYQGGYAPSAARRINAKAPYAQPMNNKGANPASGLIRAGWGWGPSPETASDEIQNKWGWGNPPKQAQPDFFRKPPAQTSNPPAGPAGAPGTRGQPNATGSGQAQTQSPAQPQSPQTLAPTSPPADPMMQAMQTHPFSNGQTLPQDMDPSTFRHTGSGYEVQMNTGSGPRQVSVSPTSDQVFNAQTGGRWDTMTPGQRGEYWRSGTLPPVMSKPISGPDSGAQAGGTPNYLEHAPQTQVASASPGAGGAGGAGGMRLGGGGRIYFGVSSGAANPTATA